MSYIESLNSNVLAEFDAQKVKQIADAWVNISAKVKKGDSVMILYDIGGRQLAEEVAKLCLARDCRVWYRVREYSLDALLASQQNNKNVARMYSFLDNEIKAADVVFLIRAVEDSNAFSILEGENAKIHSTAMTSTYVDYRVNFTNWQLIYWPTPSDAKNDKVSFEDYVKLFFDACNQPWKEIQKAQEILCEILDKGSDLTLIANPNNKKESTHLNMSIKGMTFVNSTIDNNFPGSEVFSSPVKTSVTGHLFAKGDYSEEGKLMTDIYWEVKEGKIVKATAKKGQEFLDSILDRDEGARYFGEVALGTNPALRRRFFNPLLNEKVGGSFHITPGRAYENENRNGKMCLIDNGNVSEIHWDLTIMMLPEYGGGEVIVDGKTIQKNGKFTVKGLEVLNKGL